MTRKKVLLFIVGLALTIGGIYVIDHIPSLLEGQRWTFQTLAGLGMGAVPVVVGIVIMVAVGMPEKFKKHKA